MGQGGQGSLCTCRAGGSEGRGKPALGTRGQCSGGKGRGQSPGKQRHPVATLCIHAPPSEQCPGSSEEGCGGCQVREGPQKGPGRSAPALSLLCPVNETRQSLSECAARPPAGHDPLAQGILSLVAVTCRQKDGRGIRKVRPLCGAQVGARPRGSCGHMAVTPGVKLPLESVDTEQDV